MASSINASTTGVGGIVNYGDTSGDLNLQSGGVTKIAVTSAGAAVTGTFTVNGAPAGDYNGFKNRIINGDMRIDQRNAGASVNNTAAIQYTLDRWWIYGSAVSKFSVQQNAGSVTPPTGFTNYLGVTSSSAYTVGTSEEFEICQRVEGLNCSDLGWGAAGASSVTLSFWVRSSLTGTFGGSIINSSYTRSYAFTYTILAANTWEQKTVTIAGDTSGTWLTTNGIGMQINFSLGAGSANLGTAGSWASTSYMGAIGQTSLVGTSGATLYITGVQLEKGSTATSFDVRDYGREFIMCQRYFERTGNGSAGDIVIGGYSTGATTIYNNFGYQVSKRTAPTVTKVGTWTVANAGQPVFTAGSISGMRGYISTSGTGLAYATNDSANYYVTSYAEL